MRTQNPLTVVQAQLDAYNVKDVEALLETYAPDAEQYTLHGELLAKGREQLRERFLTRFKEPNLLQTDGISGVVPIYPKIQISSRHCTWSTQCSVALLLLLIDSATKRMNFIGESMSNVYGQRRRALSKT